MQTGREPGPAHARPEQSGHGDPASNVWAERRDSAVCTTKDSIKKPKKQTEEVRDQNEETGER